MTNEEEIALLLKSAIPIDDVDQLLAPDLSFAVIWIDISERPDLQVLAEKDTLADGFSIITFFYANPGKHNMRLGMRICFWQCNPCPSPLEQPLKKVDHLLKNGLLCQCQSRPP
jgi:hypothetical protein